MSAISMYATTYLPYTATHSFCACYTDKAKPRATDRVYMSVIPANAMGAYLIVDHKGSKRDGDEVLRFKPNNTQKADMRNTWGAVAIATYGEVVERLAALKADAKAGKVMSAYSGKAIKPGALKSGHAIESIICDRWGLTWKFDNAPHTECGDITCDGTEYQVKFQGASL